MLSDGELIHVGIINNKTKIDKEYGDEVVVLKISKF